MAYRHDNREFEINEDQVADFLQNAVEKVRTSEDVDVLASLSKLFKKNVSLTIRKYVIALMLKDSLKHYRYFGNNRRNDKFGRNDRNEKFDRSERRDNRNEFKSSFRQEKSEDAAGAEASEERPRHPRVEIPEEDAISIFISIGKNRRVYPRDLVGILIAIAGLDRERIGDIKVLANYSFVQLYKDDAQQAIDRLNGYDYRGRKLAVSYSRQKGEGDEELSSEEISDAGSETVSDKIDSGYESPASMTEQDMAAEDAAALRAAERAAADQAPFGESIG